MQTKQYASNIIRELQRAIELLPEDASESFVDRLLAANRIFVAGAGRSGLMTKAFAMRLMHLGLQAYVVGETVTPGFEPGDLLLIGSGSGETASLTGMADKAKQLGGELAVVTINPASTQGQRADIVIQLSGSPKGQSTDSGTTAQPMGSLFEQMLLLFFDAVILRLMDKQSQNSNMMYRKHANLE